MSVIFNFDVQEILYDMYSNHRLLRPDYEDAPFIFKYYLFFMEKSLFSLLGYIYYVFLHLYFIVICSFPFGCYLEQCPILFLAMLRYHRNFGSIPSLFLRHIRELVATPRSHAWRSRDALCNSFYKSAPTTSVPRQICGHICRPCSSFLSIRPCEIFLSMFAVLEERVSKIPQLPLSTYF